jgi:hypothetical protein
MPDDFPSSPVASHGSPLFGNSTKHDVAGVNGFYGPSYAIVPVAGQQIPIKAGVYGVGSGNGVQGESSSQSDSGVWGNNSGGGYGVAGTSDQPNGIGVYGRGSTFAGKFEGRVQVVGTLDVTVDIYCAHGDCAEDFDVGISQKIEPGTVMVIDSNESLLPSALAYDKRVAGVVSGAGKYKPAIILDKQESSHTRLPIALMGKVYCKVDAQYGSVEVGDLLTTSPTLGHAMKAEDPLKAFGAVIGKALRPIREGSGLIPILIALQ